MAHASDQIAEAALAAVTGLTTTKRNAFRSRVHPVTEGEMPCVLVETGDEDSGPVTLGTPRRIERTMTLTIEGCVKMVEGYDKKRTQIALEVEKAIYNSPSLKSLAKDIVLAGTQRSATGEGEKTVARITLSFSVKYHTPENDPETLI